MGSGRKGVSCLCRVSGSQCVLVYQKIEGDCLQWIKREYLFINGGDDSRKSGCFLANAKNAVDDGFYRVLLLLDGSWLCDRFSA